MRISAIPDGAGANANSIVIRNALSNNGFRVAFYSEADNLVPNDNNNFEDIFLYDRQTRTIIRVSVNTAGQEGNGRSFIPAVSQDGRYVTYTSEATNLVLGDTAGEQDIFLYDSQTQ